MVDRVWGESQGIEFQGILTCRIVVCICVSHQELSGSDIIMSSDLDP